MKFILCALLLLTLCGCNQVDEKQTTQNNQQENEIITIEKNHYQDISSSQDIKKLKKYDNDLYFIETKTSDDQLSQDQIYKMNKEKELIYKTQFYQGNIYDFYVYDHFMILSDYDPYECLGQYIIVDSQGDKRDIAKTKEFFPQLYSYQNDIFYVKNDDKTQIMEYDIQTKKETCIAEYPLNDIQLHGNKDSVVWYYDNCYYVYKDSIQKIEAKNTFGNDLSIDDNYLYALEKNDSQNIISKYDMKSKTCQEFDVHVQSFVMSDDYIIVPNLGLDLHIYDKELHKKVEIKLESIKDIDVVSQNKCLILTNQHQYIEINLDDYIH